MKKRVIVLLLVLCITATAVTPAFAAPPESLEKYTAEAQTLKSLGLFLGTDLGFELERGTSRAEAAIMVVRLLGKEVEAAAANLSHPFTDVPDWADVHVGYLYRNGISNGISETLYGSSLFVTPSQFGTFLLRALGYSDADGDFLWESSLQKMLSLGIITESDFSDVSSSTQLKRAYAVTLSYACLFAGIKNESYCLLERLYYVDGAISASQLSAAATDENISPYANLYGIPAAVKGSKLSEAEIYEICHDAVFRIDLFDAYGIEYGNGSGFFISSDGYAITNSHVIDSSSSGSVLLTNGNRCDVLGILGFDPIYDLALIKVDVENVPYLTIGDYSSLKAGETVYAIGSPDGVPDVISKGVVATLSYVYDGSTYVQSTAPIYPGSSGGALINEYGQVVGVTTAGTTDASFSLSAPVTRVSEIVRRSSLLSLRYFFAHTRYGYIPFGNLIREHGDNDTAPVQTVLQDGIVDGIISDSYDVDMYSLTEISAGTILVSLASDHSNSQLLQFEILNDNGDVVAYSQHYQGEAFSFAMCNADGNMKYSVKIYTTATNSAAASYELYYVWLEPARETLYTYEFESNDSMENADYFPNNYVFLASLDTVYDVDYYRIHVASRSSFFARMAPVNSSSSSFSFTLIDVATGQTFTGISRMGEIHINVSFLDPGTYYLVVSGNGSAQHSAEAGAYMANIKIG